MCIDVHRSVEEQDKALAMGTLTVLMSIFAFIPGPLIMGAIVGECLHSVVWGYQTLGIVGHGKLRPMENYPPLGVT